MFDAAQNISVKMYISRSLSYYQETYIKTSIAALFHAYRKRIINILSITAVS